MKILLAVDDSENAVRATRNLAESSPLYKQAPEVELVTVQSRVASVGLAATIVSQDMIDCYSPRRREGARAEQTGARHSRHPVQPARAHGRSRPDDRRALRRNPAAT